MDSHAYHRQLDSGRATVCVRNTFLDICEAPPMLELRRAKTEGDSRGPNPYAPPEEAFSEAGGVGVSSEHSGAGAGSACGRNACLVVENAAVAAAQEYYQECKDDIDAVSPEVRSSGGATTLLLADLQRHITLGGSASSTQPISAPSEQPIWPVLRLEGYDDAQEWGANWDGTMMYDGVGPAWPPMWLMPVRAPEGTVRGQGYAQPQMGCMMMPAGIAPAGWVIDRQPQSLTHELSIGSGNLRIYWTVDGRKLKGNDKVAVSPPFELTFGTALDRVIFKMMIAPKVVSDGKGGASFKKAKGKGSLQLKCEGELPDLAQGDMEFSIGIAKDLPNEQAKIDCLRGPIKHNFSVSGVCWLPKELEEWDFGKVFDEESQTFVVCLEIPSPSS